MAKSNYKDDKWDGPEEFYYDNGQLKRKGIWKDSKKEGFWVFYNKDGTKRFTAFKMHSFTVDEGTGTYKNNKKVSD